LIKTYDDLVKKVEKVTKGGVDLSSHEDLSIGIMNLIAIEEHLFFTAQKTDKPQYLEILNEVRSMRTELLKKIIKDYEGEVWCISKHLLAAAMRLIEVGTKEQKKDHKKEAWDMFKKAFRLYSLFWAINLKVVDIGDVPMDDGNINFIGEKEEKLKGTASVFDKLTQVFKKAVDCCRE
jgi:hypothetical protein